MPARRTTSPRPLLSMLRFALLLIFLAGCQSATVQPTTDPTQTPRPQSTPQQIPKAEVTFNVTIPSELGEGQKLYIEFLDEVTGLALNASRGEMAPSKGGLAYQFKLPVTVGSVIKYRYVRDPDASGIEYNSLNQQVRYRMLYVDGPVVVQDVVCAWRNEPAGDALGRITGQVAYGDDNTPAVNALVMAGGLHTITASDGSFILEGLPAGTHNLVAYSLDGSFRPFQQGAVVAPDYTTPAPILVERSKLVNVTFVVHPPEGAAKGMPVRLVGNTYPLGNTFADLRGGMNVISTRTPLLTLKEDGSYTLTVKLPAGLDLRYKYSLGDGFWNGERTRNGEARVRQLIVPDRDVRVEDSIETWRSGMAPITFSVTVPANTPASDAISIQFNPFGWTEPIPMWPAGENRWFYVLYNPLDAFERGSYRYCRNDQCGIAGVEGTSESQEEGISFGPKEEPQEFKDTIEAWAWQESLTEPVIVSSTAVKQREANFQAGVELLPLYHPSWQPYLVWAFQNIRDIGGNTVILTPTWRLTHKQPPTIEPVPGKDPLWHDLTQMAFQAQQNGLAVVLHPVMVYPEDPHIWWESARRDDGWWQSWFDRYRTFILHHADLAAQTGATALILGDEHILPALPNGTLADGTPSNVSDDALTRWTRLIEEVRARYKGKLVWLLPYAGKLSPAPAFLDTLDTLYIQLSPPLTEDDAPEQTVLAERIATILDTDVLQLQEQTNQPVLLGLKFPAAAGALDGCVESDGSCLPVDAFSRPVPSYPQVEAGYQEQANVYSAALTVLNERSWLAGFFAMGYYPPVEVKDLSVSVRGKPAGEVLWYWYPRLIGQETE